MSLICNGDKTLYLPVGIVLWSSSDLLLGGSSPVSRILFFVTQFLGVSSFVTHAMFQSDGPKPEDSCGYLLQCVRRDGSVSVALNDQVI